VDETTSTSGLFLLDAFFRMHSFSMPDIFKVPSGMQRSVSIVGLGNWGSSLAHALNAAGVSLQEVILSSALWCW